ncbi:MAG: ABC transporter permease [Candidatus Nomurabacteria bacterium]|jgi:ABC-type antimicrobial peptide transport system permease subunit|nr:ABC transporter permease [Candidatus Nomurabacteria bacterium]
MRFLLRSHIKNSIDTFRANRSRSLLTSIGIAIGMACIVLIFSLSGGLKQLLGNQVAGENGNIIVVRPESNRSANDKNFLSLIGSSQTYARSSLSVKDATAIGKLDGVSSVAPLAISENNIKGEREVAASHVVASTPSLSEIVNLPLNDGAFLSDSVYHNQVVVGYKLSQKLFDAVQTVGETIKIKDKVFLVVGVLKELDAPVNYNDIDFDNAAIINIDRANQINDIIQIQQINVKVANQASVEPISERINKLLLKQHTGEPDFTVESGATVSNSTRRLFDVVGSILSIVAGVSLVVGGIGVMNIMLVSVSERTREIGIRKAVGATNGNILAQFLFESLILSLVGGLLGLGFGYAFAFGVSSMMPFNPEVSWEIVGIALGSSIALGCLFGLFPAARAARKDPIDSLRQYR